MIKVKTLKQLLLENPEIDNGIFYYKESQMSFVSYGDFWHMVEEYPLKDASSVGIFCDSSIDTLVAIFAYISNKTQVVLLDPSQDEEILKKQVLATDVDYLIGGEEFDLPLNPTNKGEKGNILFFTSGTTSSSKAVVLSEESLCASAYNGASLLPLSKDDTLLSVLPLSHVFGFVCSLLWGIECGSRIALCRERRRFFGDFSFFHPTVVSLLPQMAELLSSRNLFNSELKKVLIGAGDCQSYVLENIISKGIDVHFGYGLTETSSGIAVSLGDDPNSMRLVPEAKIKIADDGEILLDAPSLLMKGFYKDEEKTSSVMEGNYFHTGDLGILNENGDLKIIGRKKEIYVLNDGTKIFLPEFEGKLRDLLGTDLALLQNESGHLTLVLEHNVDSIYEKLNAFNDKQPRSCRLDSVSVLNRPLPRTVTGKIKRYAIDISKNNEN